MSGKKRTTVSLETGIIEKAKTMMRDEDFGDFSGFLEQVIRDRWNARTEMREAPTPYRTGESKSARK